MFIKLGDDLLLKRYLLFLFILLTITLSVSSISAGDADNATLETDIDDVAISVNDITSDVNLSSDDEDVNTDSIGSFDDLSYEINNTSEGAILVLDKDYEFVNGSYYGILISKSITIDGDGHTLNGNKISRIFNITADNVTIKNVNFINGNAYGRYFSNNVGGGAIHWSGNNGYLLNCSFENNTGSGIEDDPFDEVETYVDDQGIVWSRVRVRPMGAKTNEGGAILWLGSNGTVNGCSFKSNGVGYPNSGGAISWRGDLGKVIASEFISNDAWAGSAICWVGENGSIISSNFLDNGMGSAIMWFANTGNISDSILLDSFRSALHIYNGSVTAENNWWGDTIDDYNGTSKPNQIKSWLVLNVTADKSIVYEGDEVTANFSLKYLVDSLGISREYASDMLDFNLYLANGDVIKLVNGTGQYKFRADSTGLINGISISNGKTKINIKSLSKIKSNDLTKLYRSSKQFKVRVFADDGKVVAGKIVNLTINKKTYHARTDKNGYATLNINLKPGKYSITTQYGKVKVKNNIVVKSTLITKDISKKIKSSARFYVKVLKNTGKVYSKKTVQIKFLGKTYNVKTNSKGIAAFAIPKTLKVGKYSIRTTCDDLSNTNKIIVKK